MIERLFARPLQQLNPFSPAPAAPDATNGTSTPTPSFRNHGLVQFVRDFRLPALPVPSRSVAGGPPASDEAHPVSFVDKMLYPPARHLDAINRVLPDLMHREMGEPFDEARLRTNLDRNIGDYQKLVGSSRRDLNNFLERNKADLQQDYSRYPVGSPEWERLHSLWRQRDHLRQEMYNHEDLLGYYQGARDSLDHPGDTQGPNRKDIGTLRHQVRDLIGTERRLDQVLPRLRQYPPGSPEYQRAFDEAEELKKTRNAYLNFRTDSELNYLRDRAHLTPEERREVGGHEAVFRLYQYRNTAEFKLSIIKQYLQRKAEGKP